MSDVAEAKMLVELGVTDETIYTPDERDRVATHEAGHATVAYFVGPDPPTRRALHRQAA